MIKINWNEFVIGCGIPLGGAVLASLLFNGNAKSDNYRIQKTNPKKQTRYLSGPKGTQEIDDDDLDKFILNNDLEDFIEFPEDQYIIENDVIKNEIAVIQTPNNSETTAISDAPDKDTKALPSLLIPLPKADEFPLRLGSKGKRVWKLRSHLLRHHGADGIISEELTPKALEQIKKYLKVEVVDENLFNRLIHPGKIVRQWKK